MVAKAVETLVGPEQRFLGHVFRVRRVPQHAARHAKCQRTAFGKALLELPPGIRLSCLAHQLAPCCADWLVQDQLLHRIPSKRSQYPAARKEQGASSPYNLPDAVAEGLVHGKSCLRERNSRDW